MRIVFSLLFLLNIILVNGQITAEKKAHNFGDLYPNAQTYIDIKFTNHSDKKHFLLTIDKPRDVYYIFSGKTLLPDSSITIRLKINDGKKGKFNEEVDIYFSDSNNPTTIRLSGNVKEVASNPLTGCPEFSNDPPKNNRTEFAITIKVIDSLTREPIRRSKVYIVQNNTLIGEYFTNKEGIIHRSVPMGYYFLMAEKEAYKNNYKEGYLNFQRNYVEIELQQPPRDEDPPDLIVDVPDDPEEPEIVIDLNEDPPIEVVIVEEEIDTVPEVAIEEPEIIDNRTLAELPDSIFDKAHFKANNITFILDVSSSMNSSGKLDLLKESMTELVSILRPEDIISVIKYSSNVGVMIEGLSGDDKEKINERVAELRTSSSTAGGDAIQVAYRMSRKVYSPERNNIVIMITDGAFNKGSKTYLETIEQNYKDRGIIFSVVGIKTSEYVITHMDKVVGKGGGSFIQVRNSVDAKTKIIQEIKRTSFRER
ncbi:MAG: Ca-activated chloride channel family protein [Crocinitomix sp.]|jgi:Ca-activated chloride channel family protein